MKSFAQKYTILNIPYFFLEECYFKKSFVEVKILVRYN